MHTRQEKMMQTEGLVFELGSYPRHIAYLFEGAKLIAMTTNGWGKHAEMGILPYLCRTKKQSLYVRRVNGNSFMSRPCVRCSSSLRHVSPGLRVFYTNKSGEWIEDKYLDTNHRSRNDNGQASTTYRLKQKYNYLKKQK